MANPIEQFEIKPLVPIEIGGVDVSFTNSALWMAIAVVLSTTLLTISMRKKAMVPGRMQVFSEMLYDFIAGMVRENVGSGGRKFFPFVFTLFVVVIMGNMLGMIPYSFTYTSHIVVTGILAVFIFLMVTLLGFMRHGMHFFHFFLPPGVPGVLAPLVILIELISFLIRPVTLSVRLFANMMAGHLMLKVFAGFSVMMFAGLGATGLLLGLLPFLFNSLLIGFEFLIAYLQAYVFTILTCIYIKDSIELH